MTIFAILGVIFCIVVLINLVIAIIQEIRSTGNTSRVYSINHNFYIVRKDGFYIIPTISIIKSQYEQHNSYSITFHWLCLYYELYYHIIEE